MEKVSNNSSICNDRNDRSDHKAPVTSVTLKGSVFTLPIVKIHSSDLKQIARDLQTQLKNSRGFFTNSPVIIDLSLVQNHTIDFGSLKILLMGQELVPVGIQGGSTKQQLSAIGQGLGIIPIRAAVGSKKTEHHTNTKHVNQSTEIVDEVVESKISPRDAVDESHSEVMPNEETLVVNQPIRSGQRIYARGGDLIQLAAVNAGAEIMADGNIHIYAPLRGRALAGVTGNKNARIYCHSFEAELVAIAGSYKVFEDNIDIDLQKKTVEISLQQEQLIIRSIS
ncbi:MAG: septum site-determining protein MinC [Thiohalomonadales bacterium]